MKTVRCPQCNLANWETESNCQRCGLYFEPADVQPPASELNTELDSLSPEAHSHAFQPRAARPAAPNHGQNKYQPTYQTDRRPSNQKTGMAIASMVMGIVGCFLTAPVGLILGIIALVRANRRPSEYGGKGFAIAGIALNVLGVLTLPIIAAIAIPNLLAARRAANEASAINTVRRIADAEVDFRETMAGKCGDIKALIATRLLEVDLASEEKNGYRFQVINLPRADGGCEIHAVPLSTSQGRRSFYYSTEDETLRAADKKGRPAGKDDDPLEFSRERRNSRPPKIAIQKPDSF